MAVPWSQIESDPDFRSLKGAEQQKLKTDYFSQNIASDPDFKALGKEDKSAFIRDFFKPPQAPPGPLDTTQAFGKKAMGATKQFMTEGPGLPIAGMLTTGAMVGAAPVTGGASLAPILATIAAGGLGAGMGESLRQGIQTLRGKEQANPMRLAEEVQGGIIGAGTGKLAEGALRGFAPEAQRIFPGMVSSAFGVPEASAESLFKNPQQTAKLAKEGMQGVMGKAVDFVKNARVQLARSIRDSNADLKLFKESAIQTTKGGKVIPTDRIILETSKDAVNKGLIEGLPSTDKLGLSTVNKFINSLKILGGKNNAISVEDSILLHNQLNQAIGNPKISPTVKTVLQTYKNGLRDGLKFVVGPDKADEFESIMARQSTLRSFNDDVLPALKGNNAPLSVARNVENNTALGQRFVDFDEALGGGLIEPIQTALRAVPFGANVVRGTMQGASLPVALKLPVAAASRIPYLGRLVSPQSVAKGVSAASRIPTATNLATRVAVQSGIFSKKPSER